MSETRVGPMPPTIAGYRIEEVLGRGGMGVVYKARQPELNRWVAVKMIRTEGAPGPEAMARFRLEAEAVARMQHPNIVQVFLVGEAEGRPYLVLEYLDGGSLADRARAGPLVPREAARLVATLADAVHHAHRRGIVHRDLKPSNVLLTADGVPKVGDFGLALADGDVENRPGQSGACGTVGYMSPEQAWGSNRLREVGPAADVYALGVILYELITGRRPFQGESAQETLRLAFTQEPPPLRGGRRGVSRDLEAVCRKCLRREPHDRYADAGALADDLGRYLRGEPTAARPVDRPERAWMWCRRNPLSAGLLAVAAVAMVTASGFAASALTAKALADQRREQAADSAYFNLIALADRESRAGRMDQAEALLRSYRPEPPGHDRRGFEWYHLRRRVRAEDVRFRFHLPKGVGALCHLPLAFTPDERGLTVAPGVLYDLKGQPIAVRRPEQRFDLIALSPDGALGAGARQFRSEIVVWSTADGAVRHRLAGHTGHTTSDLLELGMIAPMSIFCLDFSPDGRSLVSVGTDGFVRVWDVVGGRETARLDLNRAVTGGIMFGHVTSAVFGAGDLMVVALMRHRFSNIELRRGPLVTNWKLLAWQTRTDRPQFSSPLAVENIPVDGVRAVLAVRPDGREVAVAASDHTIALYDTTTGERGATLRGHDAAVLSLAYSRDGSRLISGGKDRTARVWSVFEVDQSPLVFPAHEHGVDGVAISADGRRLATRSQAFATHSQAEVKVWHLDRVGGVRARDAHPKMALVPFARGALAVAISPDGNLLASGGGAGGVKLWRPASLELLSTLELDARVFDLAFSPDGRLLAVAHRSPGGYTVSVWDVARRQRLNARFPEVVGLESVAFSPDGRTLATGEEGLFSPARLQLWEPTTGRARWPEPRALVEGSVSPIFRPDRFRPDRSELIAVSTKDGTGRAVVVDPLTGRPLRDEPGVQAVAFSPDGYRIARAFVPSNQVAVARVSICDAQTGAALAEFPLSNPYGIRLLFSPDGSRLATADRHPADAGAGSLTLWDARTGRGAITLTDEAGGLNDFTFSPDGTLLISAWEDGSLRVWDATPLPAATP